MTTQAFSFEADANTKDKDGGIFLDSNKIILWLSQIEGIGAKKIGAILDEFNDTEKIWYAPPDKFLRIPSLSKQNIDTIIKERDANLLEAYIKKLRALNISYVTVQNEKYPRLLKEIHDPPAVLYFIGDIPEFPAGAVSIIGSRRCSEYGLTVSHKLSRDLAQRGIVIISGMAKGIDSSAHRGALEGGGITVAVLGCGADICYPSENRVLREQIIKSGCVISEYPPGTKPLPGNFPVRNRIISGLAQAVVVVEAAEQSGTLITVDMALEQGREVLAVPGNITSKLSAGVNNLIKQGAGALVNGYRDVLEAICYEEPPQRCKAIRASELNLAPDEKLVYDCMSFEPVSAESIAESINLEVNKVIYLATMLEIKGGIKKMPGQRYILN